MDEKKWERYQNMKNRPYSPMIEKKSPKVASREFARKHCSGKRR